MATEQTEKKPQAEIEDFDLVKEKPFKISLRGIWDGWRKVTYDKMTGGIEKLTRWTNDHSKNWLHGRLAVVTMPLALMIRNGSRVAHEANNEGYDGISTHVGGGIAILAGVIGGTYYGQGWVAEQLPTALSSGWLGSGFTYAATAVTTALVGWHPLRAAGSFVATSIAGTGAFCASSLGAAINLGTGLQRTLKAWHGVKYTPEQLKLMEFDPDSVQAAYETDRLAEAQRHVGHLSVEQRHQIYDSLQHEFNHEAQAEAHRNGDPNWEQARYIHPSLQPRTPQNI